jgi:hypothetical protein
MREYGTDNVVTDVDIIKLCENREACISKLFSEVSEYKSLEDYPFNTLEKIEQALSERGYVKVYKEYITNYHYKIKEI